MTRAQRLRGRNADDGFTLIEVIVALVIFALVTTAAVGMLTAATKVGLVAKMDTGAKELSQERIEKLRNLPFHIDHPTGAAASTVETDDLLDTYFKAYSATNATCRTPGFVHGGTATASLSPSASDVRCTAYGDPSAGDFYRVVVDPVPGFPRYKQYIATQFLGPSGANGAAYDVPSTYNTQGDPATADQPPSNLVGSRVVTLWTVGSTSKRSNVFTLLAAGRPAATTVAFSSRATGLTVTGKLANGLTFNSQAGLLNLDGAATRNTVASTQAQAVFAGVDPGDRNNGACALASSSGTTAACSAPNSTGLSLKDASGNVLGTFGPSSTTGASQSTANSLPQAGAADSSGNPTTLVVSSVDSSGSAPDVGGQTIYGVSTVVPTSGTLGDAALKLSTSKPLVYIDKPSNGTKTVCGNASAPAVTGQSITSSGISAAGYAATTNGTTHFSTVCLATQTQGLHLFPTTFAPQGILLVTFSSQLTCRTNGGLYNSASNPNGGQAIGTYAGTVQTWNTSTGAWGSPISFSPSAPLDTVLPLTTAVAPGLTLANYVGSWSSTPRSAMDASVLIDQDNNAVTVNYDSLFKLSSTLLYAADANSTFSVLMGSLSCRAEDNR